MRVGELNVERRRLRLREPLHTAWGVVSERETLLLEARGEGLTGLGEAAPLPGYDTESLEEVEAAIRGPARDAVLGAEAVAGAPAALDGLGLPRHAHAATEAAVLDLAARAAGQPLWRLLAPAASPGALDLAALIGAQAPEAAGEQAAAAVSAGFETLKVKVGPGTDLSHVRAVRDAVGEGVAVRVDANRAWSERQALEMLAELHELAVELVEEPLEAPDPATLAGLRSHSPVAIAADESAATPEQARALVRSGCVDAIVVKLGRCGGPLAALAIAAEAPTVIFTSNMEGAVGVAAAAHVALAAGGSARGHAHGLATLGLLEGHPPDEPRLEPPSEPGVGDPLGG